MLIIGGVLYYSRVENAEKSAKIGSGQDS